MKTLLLSTAAALALCGAAYAQVDAGAAAATSSPAASAALQAGANLSAPAAPPASAAPPAAATSAASETPATSAAPATSTNVATSAFYTDDEVAKVASAAAETRRLNAEGQAKIAAATTPEAKAEATTELQTALQAAVTTRGLTVSRYNEIAKASTTDAALAARLTANVGAKANQGEASPASGTAPQ